MTKRADGFIAGQGLKTPDSTLAGGQQQQGQQQNGGGQEGQQQAAAEDPEGKQKPQGQQQQQAPEGQQQQQNQPGGEGQQGQQQQTQEQQGSQENQEGQQQQASETTEAGEDIPEDKILAMLKKRGIDAKSLDELKPKPTLSPEEQEAAAENERTAAINFGLEKKLFTRKDYEQFIADTRRTPEDIALQVFSNVMLAADNTLKPEDINARFREYFRLDHEDSDWQKTLKAQEMKDLAVSYINKTHAKVTGVTDEYRAEQQIKQDALSYHTSVKQSFNTIGKTLTHTIKDEEGEFPFQFNIPEKVIKDATDIYLSSEHFNALNGIEPEELTAAIRLSMLEKMLPQIIAEGAKSYHAHKVETLKMIRQGVPERQVEQGHQSSTSTKQIPGRATQIMKGQGLAVPQAQQT